jgi:hypothetical protein
VVSRLCDSGSDCFRQQLSKRVSEPSHRPSTPRSRATPYVLGDRPRRQPRSGGQVCGGSCTTLYRLEQQDTPAVHARYGENNAVPIARAHRIEVRRDLPSLSAHNAIAHWATEPRHRHVPMPRLSARAPRPSTAGQWNRSLGALHRRLDSAPASRRRPTGCALPAFASRRPGRR